MMNGGDISHYRKKHCSPFKHSESYSCFSHKALLKIANALTKIDGIDVPYEDSNDKRLYSNICKAVQNNFGCNTEACWLNIRKLMKNLSNKDADYFREYFRPKMPKEIVDDYTEWISNFDIESVLEQYNKDVSDFYFYGAVPIDFRKCSVSNLCKVNIGDHVKKGENKIGIVFNTDESDESGKHWISMYIDIEGRNLEGQPGIYYFDSFGSRPGKEVKNLISKLQKQGNKNDIEFVVSHNDKSFQNNTFSCGYYCMHFLEQMIKGDSFSSYLKSGINDKKMIRYQKQCYLHPEEIKKLNIE